MVIYLIVLFILIAIQTCLEIKQDNVHIVDTTEEVSNSDNNSLNTNIINLNEKINTCLKILQDETNTNVIFENNIKIKVNNDLLNKILELLNSSNNNNLQNAINKEINKNFTKIEASIIDAFNIKLKNNQEDLIKLKEQILTEKQEQEVLIEKKQELAPIDNTSLEPAQPVESNNLASKPQIESHDDSIKEISINNSAQQSDIRDTQEVTIETNTITQKPKATTELSIEDFLNDTDSLPTHIATIESTKEPEENKEELELKTDDIKAKVDELKEKLQIENPKEPQE